MKAIFLNFTIIMTLIITGALFASSGARAMETKEFTYEVDGQKYQGYFAEGAPEGGKTAGVLVAHEWWGHNEYPRKRAEMLAEEGYVALAIDMFGVGKVAEHPKEAQKFAAESMQDPQRTQKVFNKGLEILKGHKAVDASKIAAIGYCYGGTLVLNMAKMGSDLDLIASFHGGLPQDYSIPKRENNPKVLIFNGGSDPMVTQEQIKGLKSAFAKAELDYDFVNYKEAKHAFTNPKATEKGKKFDLPLEYNKKADEDSWSKLLAELKKL